MNFNIISAFHPLKQPIRQKSKNAIQNDDCTWNYESNDGKILPYSIKEDYLGRCLKALKKNSVYKHKVIIYITFF